MIRAILILFLGALFASCSTNKVRIRPRSPESQIRETVLLHTPLNASADQVLSFINTRLHHKGNPWLAPHGAQKRAADGTHTGVLIGTQSISSIEVGHHLSLSEFPLTNYVYLTWAFDSRGRLIDVLVNKEIDGP